MQQINPKDPSFWRILSVFFRFMLISADVGGQKTSFTGTLHGLLGSTAEAYAAADNIKFETVTCHYIYEANGGSGAPLPAILRMKNRCEQPPMCFLHTGGCSLICQRFTLICFVCYVFAEKAM